MRTHHLAEFPVEQLVSAKAGTTISVCIPARDEATTIGAIVGRIVADLVERHSLVDEVLVVDDGSADATAAVAAGAGARVVRAGDVLAGWGPGGGKGEAMWKSLAECRGEVVVWCDADIVDFAPRFVVGLLGPLLGDPGVAFVKACYRRDLDGRPGEGGRVTELVARPLVSLLFPHLEAFAQPLAGEYAGRREVLERLPFAPGYGVDLGLLIDAAALVGTEAMAQVDLGRRSHRNRPLRELAGHAEAVLTTALDRAGVATFPGAVPAPPDRPPLAEVPAYRDRRS